MSSGTDAPAEGLEAGRAAFAGRRWFEALEALQAADQAGELDAADLERLGEAAWWNSQFNVTIDARERAFALYTRAGQTVEAAHIALELARDYLGRLQMPLTMAFMGRAERLLSESPESPVHGELTIMKAVFAYESGQGEEALALARETANIAQRFGSHDLEAMALLWQGRVLISRGDVAEGLALVDEASGAALIGDLNPQTTGLVYCWTIAACADLADYERAGEWTDAALRWCERNADSSGFPGICRVHQAEVLRFRGEWPLAEQAAVRAAEELSQAAALAGEAWYEVGEVRLRTGELEAAEQAFRQAHEFGRVPEPGLAMLRLARGQADRAVKAVRGVLQETTTPLRRSKVLPPYVEVAIAAGEVEEARSAAAELAEIAETYESPGPMLEALATCARGHVALAMGDADEAVEPLRRALRIWLGLNSPYEAAKTRLLLATALQELGDEDSAVMELESAKSGFERLGARPDVRTATSRLQALGVGARDQHAVRTFMFTDIVESTPLIEAIGDDAWTDLVRWHDHTLRALFASHRGEEVNHAGDGFLVAFANPDSALDCGVAVQRQLTEHRRAHGFAPRVRIGLHIAEAVGDGETYWGRGVHEAARIAALAGADEVLASLTTTESAQGDYPRSPPREVTLKGIEEPLSVVSLDWSASSIP